MATRLDLEMVARQIASSRSAAQLLIEQGAVLLNGSVCTKAARKVNERDEIAIEQGRELQFVSQGGEKLAHAIQQFSLSFEGLRVLDIGSSTGGFTDCALRHGAKCVYALDVGTEQLHESLRNDPRIHLHENLHIKDASLDILDGSPTDTVVCDVSFISLTHVLPRIHELLRVDGWAVCLVKPQFEVGPNLLTKNGIAKHPQSHIQAIKRVMDQAKIHQLAPQALCYSPLGGHGKNIEYLLHLQHYGAVEAIDVEAIVANANYELR